MTDFDSPWKEALDLYFEAFLAFFFPIIHAEVDWARGYESLDKELQQVVREAELGRRVVDKLVKVWRNDGWEEWLLIHVEIQGQVEADFGQRMYVYNYRLFDRYNRTVVSLAVLADDQAGWRPGSYGHGAWGCSVDFRFPSVKLLDYQADEAALEAHANPFAVLVLAHLKTLETRKQPESRRAWKMRVIRGLFERGFSRENVNQLLRLVDWMMYLPKELQRQFVDELFDYEEEKRMPYITTFERHGAINELLAALAVTLDVKFGPEGLQLMPELREIYDLDVLRAVRDAIKPAKTLDDLRQIYSQAEGPSD